MATYPNDWLESALEPELRSLATWYTTNKNIKQENSRQEADRYHHNGQLLRINNVTASERWVQIVKWRNPHKPRCTIADRSTKLDASFTTAAIEQSGAQHGLKFGALVNITCFDIIVRLDEDDIQLLVKSCEVGSTLEGATAPSTSIQHLPSMQRLISRLKRTHAGEPEQVVETGPDVEEIDAATWAPSQRSTTITPKSNAPARRMRSPASLDKTLGEGILLQQGINLQAPVPASKAPTRPQPSPPTGIGTQARQLYDILNPQKSKNQPLPIFDPALMFKALDRPWLDRNASRQNSDLPPLHQTPVATADLHTTLPSQPGQGRVETQESSIGLMTQLPARPDTAGSMSSQSSDLLSQGPAEPTEVMHVESRAETRPEPGEQPQPEIDESPLKDRELSADQVQEGESEVMKEDAQEKKDPQASAPAGPKYVPLASIVVRSATGHRMPHPLYVQHARRRLPPDRKSQTQIKDLSMSPPPRPATPITPKGNKQAVADVPIKDIHSSSAESSETDDELPNLPPASTAFTNGTQSPEPDSSAPFPWSSSPIREPTPRPVGPVLPPDSSAEVSLPSKPVDGDQYMEDASDMDDEYNLDDRNLLPVVDDPDKDDKIPLQGGHEGDAHLQAIDNLEGNSRTAKDNDGDVEMINIVQPEVIELSDQSSVVSTDFDNLTHKALPPQSSKELSKKALLKGMSASPNLGQTHSKAATNAPESKLSKSQDSSTPKRYGMFNTVAFASSSTIHAVADSSRQITETVAHLGTSPGHNTMKSRLPQSQPRMEVRVEVPETPHNSSNVLDNKNSTRQKRAFSPKQHQTSKKRQKSRWSMSSDDEKMDPQVAFIQRKREFFRASRSDKIREGQHDDKQIIDLTDTAEPDRPSEPAKSLISGANRLLPSNKAPVTRNSIDVDMENAPSVRDTSLRKQDATGISRNVFQTGPAGSVVESPTIVHATPQTTFHSLLASFKAAYPYTGTDVSFQKLCQVLLESDSRISPEDWDIYVLAYDQHYGPYVKQCLEDFEAPLPYFKYWTQGLSGDVCISKQPPLLNPQVIRQALDNSPPRSASVTSSVVAHQPVEPPMSSKTILPRAADSNPVMQPPASPTPLRAISLTNQPSPSPQQLLQPALPRDQDAAQLSKASQPVRQARQSLHLRVMHPDRVAMLSSPAANPKTLLPKDPNFALPASSAASSTLKTAPFDSIQVPSGGKDGIPPLSSEQIARLDSLQEPQRAAAWMTEVFESHPPSSELRQGHVYKAYKNAFEKSKVHKLLKGRELLNYFPHLFKGASIGRTQADIDDGLFLIRGVRVKQPVEADVDSERRCSSRESARPSGEEMHETSRGDRFSDATRTTTGHIAPPSAPRAMREAYVMQNGQPAFSMAPPLAPARHSARRDGGNQAGPLRTSDQSRSFQASYMAGKGKFPHGNTQRPASSTLKKVKLGDDDATSADTGVSFPLSPSHNAEAHDKSPLPEFCDRYARLGIMTSRENAWATNITRVSLPRGDRRKINVLSWKLGSR